jgi:transposase InsO family protein
MAVRRRRPRKTVIHSDQGSQYGSDDWRRFCETNHLEPSMSRRGNCWDNAAAESFFSSLKKECIKKKIYRTRVLAQAELAVAKSRNLFNIRPEQVSVWSHSLMWRTFGRLHDHAVYFFGKDPGTARRAFMDTALGLGAVRPASS